MPAQAQIDEANETLAAFERTLGAPVEVVVAIQVLRDALDRWPADNALIKPALLAQVLCLETFIADLPPEAIDIAVVAAMEYQPCPGCDNCSPADEDVH